MAKVTSFGTNFIEFRLMLRSIGGFEVGGTVTGISAFGALGIGGGIWHLKKVRATIPVTCGVQTNENRYDFLKAITLTLCCDNGTATTFCVALTDRTFKTTSVGLGWSDFCKANQFHIGDAIYFKFAESISSNVSHAFKLLD
ncbi:wall-associated receptor kinase [Trifolium repens]|nr:wall-associated receptor kinase [Trifolium repens]